MFLVRFLMVAAVLAGLGLAGLFALGSLVEPERREVQVNLPMPQQAAPRPKG